MYYFPRSGFIISGENLNFVDKINWGDNVIEDVKNLGTTGLSGKLPANAITSEVIVETAVESINLGVKGVVLGSGNRILTSELDSDFVSGEAGSLISINGENFTNITEVNFGNTSSEFSIISTDEIQAIIPENADYSKITIFNGLNTGISGSVSEASGLTLNEFVPIPQVTGLSSGQLVSGETLTILGSSFSGVTGVSFNNIESPPISVPSSVEIKAIIPSGNTKGSPRLLLKSGQYVDTLSNYTFTPSVRVDAIKKRTGAAVTDGLKTGELFRLQGANFSTGILYATGDGYLWSLGDTTGTFTIIDDTEISGLVPTGITIRLTGDANPSLAELDIKIYSNEYPNSYNSEVKFPPLIGPPVISFYEPNLNTLPYGQPSAFTSGTFVGVTGDVITAFGENLIGLTGMSIIPSQANVGVGTTSDFSTFTPSPDGKSMSIKLPTGENIFGNFGEFFTTVYSGRFGETTGVSSFFAIGEAVIFNQQQTANPGIVPAENVLPGATGFIRGRSFVSGSEVLLYKDNFNDENLVKSLPTSGYQDQFNWGQISFTYPNSFATGIDYKLTVRNPRGLATSNPSYQDFSIQPIPSPMISGFVVDNSPNSINPAPNWSDYPQTGDTTARIYISGFFSTPSGSDGKSNLFYDVEIGNIKTQGFAYVPEGYAYPGFTNSGISTPFLSIGCGDLGGVNAPITIITSGGSVTSKDNVNIIPARPNINRFYAGGGASPYATGQFAGNSTYYGDGNLITVSGERMGLVTGVEFSGQSDNIISTNLFTRRAGSYITFPKPANTNLESGIFQLSDSFGRKVQSSQSGVVTGIKPVTLSGFDSIAMPGASISVSGNNIVGANELHFSEISGDVKIVEAYSYTNHGNNMWTNKYYVPTGIAADEITFVNRDASQGGVIANPEIFNSLNNFNPLTEVKGVHPFPSVTSGQASYSTGQNIIITGINADRSFTSGDFVVGITGTGLYENAASVHFYTVTGYETGSGLAPNLQYNGSPAQPNTFYNNISLQLDNGFIGSGHIFITNPWDDFTDIREEFIGSSSETYLPNQIINFPGPFKYYITGTPVEVTGYGPSRGITGSLLEVTGKGLDPITGVFFEIDDGPRLEADFTINSDSHLSITVPKEGIEARGMTDVLLSGGTNTVIEDFEILLDTTTVEFNTLPEGEAPTTNQRTSQFTIEETINGTVFLVTRTRFPDGTTSVISSVPKP